MTSLTPTQQQVLDDIVEFICSQQRWPTLEEIAVRFGWKSLNSARLHLLALERLGRVSVADRRYRVVGLTLTPTFAAEAT